VTDHEADAAAAGGEEQRGLSGGVGAAYDDDRFAAAVLGFDLGGRVEDAGTLQLTPAGER
jgi:hypothetical protein